MSAGATTATEYSPRARDDDNRDTDKENSVNSSQRPSMRPTSAKFVVRRTPSQTRTQQGFRHAQTQTTTNNSTSPSTPVRVPRPYEDLERLSSLFSSITQIDASLATQIRRAPSDASITHSSTTDTQIRRAPSDASLAASSSPSDVLEQNRLVRRLRSEVERLRSRGSLSSLWSEGCPHASPVVQGMSALCSSIVRPAESLRLCRQQKAQGKRPCEEISSSSWVSEDGIRLASALDASVVVYELLRSSMTREVGRILFPESVITQPLKFLISAVSGLFSAGPCSTQEDARSSGESKDGEEEAKDDEDLELSFGTTAAKRRRGGGRSGVSRRSAAPVPAEVCNKVAEFVDLLAQNDLRYFLVSDTLVVKLICGCVLPAALGAAASEVPVSLQMSFVGFVHSVYVNNPSVEFRKLVLDDVFTNYASSADCPECYRLLFPPASSVTVSNASALLLLLLQNRDSEQLTSAAVSNLLAPARFKFLSEVFLRDLLAMCECPEWSVSAPLLRLLIERVAYSLAAASSSSATNSTDGQLVEVLSRALQKVLEFKARQEREGDSVAVSADDAREVVARHLAARRDVCASSSLAFLRARGRDASSDSPHSPVVPSESVEVVRRMVQALLLSEDGLDDLVAKSVNLLINLNSPATSAAGGVGRKCKLVKALSTLVQSGASCVLRDKRVRAIAQSKLSDPAISVREHAMDLISKCLAPSLSSGPSSAATVVDEYYVTVVLRCGLDDAGVSVKKHTVKLAKAVLSSSTPARRMVVAELVAKLNREEAANGSADLSEIGDVIVAMLSDHWFSECSVGDLPRILCDEILPAVSTASLACEKWIYRTSRKLSTDPARTSMVLRALAENVVDGRLPIATLKFLDALVLSLPLDSQCLAVLAALVPHSINSLTVLQASVPTVEGNNLLLLLLEVLAHLALLENREKILAAFKSAQLEGLLLQLVVSKGMAAVNACAKLLARMSYCRDDPRVVSFCESLKSGALSRPCDPCATAAGKLAVLRELYTFGVFSQYFEVRFDASESVSVILAFLASRPQDAEVMTKGLQALVCVAARSPELLTSAPGIAAQFRSAMTSGNPLLLECCLSIINGSLSLNVSSPLVDTPLLAGDAEVCLWRKNSTTVGSFLAQQNSQQIISVLSNRASLLCTSPRLSNALLTSVDLMVRHGLVNPVITVPSLVACCCVPDSVSSAVPGCHQVACSKAVGTLRQIEEKFPGFVLGKTADGVALSYSLLGPSDRPAVNSAGLGDVLAIVAAKSKSNSGFVVGALTNRLDGCLDAGANAGDGRRAQYFLQALAALVAKDKQLGGTGASESALRWAERLILLHSREVTAEVKEDSSRVDRAVTLAMVLALKRVCVSAAQCDLEEVRSDVLKQGAALPRWLKNVLAQDAVSNKAIDAYDSLIASQPAKRGRGRPRKPRPTAGVP